MNSRESRPWQPGNPGLPDLDSNGPFPEWRSTPGLSDMVMWWLQSNGHLASSQQDADGRGGWWPTLALGDHVPRSDSDFIEWVVQETPARSWSKYDLAKLRAFGLFHGWVSRTPDDRYRLTFIAARPDVDIDAPFGIGLCKRHWDEKKPWTAADFHDVQFFLPADGLQDAHSLFTHRTSPIKIANMPYWLELGFEVPRPDRSSS